MNISPGRRRLLEAYSSPPERAPSRSIALYNAASLRSFFAASWPTRVCDQSDSNVDRDNTIAIVLASSPESSPKQRGDSYQALVRVAQEQGIPLIYVPSVSARGKSDSAEIAVASDVVLASQPSLRSFYESVGAKVLPVLPIRNAGFLSTLILGHEGSVPKMRSDTGTALRRSATLNNPSPALERVFRRYPETLFLNDRLSYLQDPGRPLVSTQERLCLGTHGVIGTHSPNAGTASLEHSDEGALPTSVTVRSSPGTLLYAADGASHDRVYRSACEAWDMSGLSQLEDWMAMSLDRGVGGRRLEIPLLIEQAVNTEGAARAVLAGLGTSSRLPATIHLNTRSGFASELYWLTASLQRRVDVRVHIEGNVPEAVPEDPNADLMVLRRGSQLGVHSVHAAGLLVQGLRDIRAEARPLLVNLVNTSNYAFNREVENDD